MMAPAVVARAWVAGARRALRRGKAGLLGAVRLVLAGCQAQRAGVL
jgi:hypothetical protein